MDAVAGRMARRLGTAWPLSEPERSRRSGRARVRLWRVGTAPQRRPRHSGGTAVMTDKPYVSPPLLRPLRSEEEARRDIAKRRHRAPEGECEYCDNHRRAGADFHPDRKSVV